MIVDLVIRGGTVVTSKRDQRLAVAVHQGQIFAVDRDEAMPEAREAIDATGLHVLPGLIDTHVHLRDPGRPEREDWLTGTRAAAAGGITTIMEMPISIPPVHTAAVLQERAAHVQPRSIVDFALYGGASGDNLDEIEAMAAAGAVAFKTFRTRPFRGRENEFVGICCPDAGQMLHVMERTARTGRLHVVHAEEQQILDAAAARVREAGRRDGRAHALARPEAAEVASVAQCIALAQATGARLQIAHMSTADAAALVAQAKQRGLPVTAETCPHYLTFTEDALEEYGPFAKCDPPLRPRETVERLWEAIRARTVDVLGTDHAPFLLEERAPFFEDIWSAPSGLPGLEEFLPLMLRATSQGRLTLPYLVRLTSENAARLFGLWPRKGRLAARADADLVLVDLRAERVHDHRTLQTKARDVALIYDGMRLRGLPVMTIVRGRVVMRNGEVVGEPGWGQWVKPQ
ncbi:MAG: allantoinase AllB [Armatimonadetes bacterium]|nr:allantoinase AllB [Armatimonadota bacterium]